MRNIGRQWIVLFVALLLGPPAMAQFPVNVLQDCWTTGNEADLEMEDYEFFPGGPPIVFVWKHKLMDPCANYVVSIFGFECKEGKPKPQALRFGFRDIQFGGIDPDPLRPELLFRFIAPPGSIPPGRYDWAMLVECNDSNGGIPIGPDGDIDDECGINVGVAPAFPPGPVIFGPEPSELFDPDPGGFPPGRGPGEEGTTRPWCFEVF